MTKQQRTEEIQHAISQTLMQHWDPIGVSDVPAAHDEYDSYVGPVYRMLSSGATDAELVDYLYKTETETMGLTRFWMRGHLKKVLARLREIDVTL